MQNLVICLPFSVLQVHRLLLPYKSDIACMFSAESFSQSLLQYLQNKEVLLWG